MALAGFAFFFGLAAASVVGYENSLYVFFGAGACAIVSTIFVRKIKLITLALWAFTMALCIFALSYYFTALPTEALTGKSGELTGTVVDRYSQEGLYTYTVKVREADFTELKEFTVSVTSFSSLRVSTYDEINCNIGEIKLVDNEGLRNKGIYIAAPINMDRAYTASANSEKSIAALGYKVNRYFSRQIYSCLPPESAQLVDAMLLGNVRGGELKESFKYAGGSHLLVVSGLHLSIIASIFIFILKRLRVGKNATWILAGVAVVSYGIITGGKSSILRASIMYMVLIVGNLLGRENDSLNSMGLACIIIGITRPLGVMDSGLILSMLSTLGIITLHQPIARLIVGRRRGKFIRGFGELMAVPLSALVLVQPAVILLFNEFSLASVVTSLVLEIPSVIIIFGGLIICIFGAFAAALAPLTLAVSFVCKITLGYVENIPKVFTLATGDMTLIVFMLSVILVGFIFVVKYPPAKAVGLAGVLIINLSAPIINAVYFSSTARIICMSRGGGYSVAVIENGQGRIYGKTMGNRDEKLLGTMGIRSIEDMGSSEADFEINGRQIHIDFGEHLGEFTESDIYICREPSDNVISMFTIIAGNDIINADMNELPAGNYIISQEATAVDINKNGDVKFVSLP